MSLLYIHRGNDDLTLLNREAIFSMEVTSDKNRPKKPNNRGKNDPYTVLLKCNGSEFRFSIRPNKKVVENSKGKLGGVEVMGVEAVEAVIRSLYLWFEVDTEVNVYMNNEGTVSSVSYATD